MSNYNATQEYNDRLFSQQQHAVDTIKELTFKVRAYEQLLSEADITEVHEELRYQQLLEAYPPLVYPAYEKLQEVHEMDHDDDCLCISRAIEVRNQDAVDNYDPYDDFVRMD